MGLERIVVVVGISIGAALFWDAGFALFAWEGSNGWEAAGSVPAGYGAGGNDDWEGD